MIKLNSDSNYVIHFAIIPNAMRVQKHDRKKKDINRGNFATENQSVQPTHGKKKPNAVSRLRLHLGNIYVRFFFFRCGSLCIFFAPLVSVQLNVRF